MVDANPKIQTPDFKALARNISLVENESGDYLAILQQSTIDYNIPLIGITGPPGAGKSTLINSLIGKLVANEKRVAIIMVDPSSPFNFGALLGDRIRLSDFYNHPQVYIRSLATRGSLGGLSDKIIEVADVLRGAGFDYILIETVGVGQSEVEIAGLADTTVVVLVPESGDEVQTMKAGVMEIADIFVVNKSDRPKADAFAKNLKKLVHAREKQSWKIPVLKTVATQDTGIEELIDRIDAHASTNTNQDRKALLLTSKAWQLIQKKKMRDIDRKKLQSEIVLGMEDKNFNLYTFLQKNY